MCACALRTVVRRGARGHVREALAGGAALVRREAAACVSYVHICARVRYVRSCGAVRAAMCARRSLVERRWCGARRPRVCRMCIYVRVCATYGRAARCARPCARGARWWSGAGAARGGRVCVVCAYMCACALRTVVRRGARGHVREALAGGAALVRREAAACVSYVHICARVRYVRSCGAVRAAMCARRSLVERRWCGARRPRVCRMCIYVRVCATYGRAARCARPCARGARWWSGAGAARGGRVCVVCAYMCACALRTVVRRGARGHVREALAGGAALVRREAAACVSYVHICARVRYVRSCGAVRAAMCARRSLVERRWCGARRPRVCRMCIYVRVCATYGRAARCARPCARGARWWSGAGAARGGRVCVVCAYMCACALRTVVRRGARGHVREALAGGAALVRREAAACVSYVHICARVRYVRSCGAVRAAMCARRSLVERRWCGARRPRVCRMCIYVRVCATYGRAARCARPCARGARWWSGAGAARGGRVCVVCAYMCACALRTVVRRGARGHVREALAGGAALVRREAAACVSYVHICARVRYVRSCGAVRAAMCARRSLVERRWCGARRPRVCRMCIYVRVCATYGRAARCARPCARGARWWSGAGAARGGRVCVVCAYMCACALRTVVRRGARGHVREALAGGAALVRREAAACVSYVHICARVRYVRSCGAVRAAMCARRSLVERRWCGARRPRVCRMCIYVRVCATYGRAARCARPCARGARWWSGAGAARGGRVCVVCAYMCACALRTVVRRGARGHVREALAGGAALVRREAAACVSYVHICARVRYVRSCGAVRAAMCARRSLVERRCAARGGRVCVVCAYMCACALRTVVRRGARGHVREALAGGAALVRREAAACVSYVHICARVRYVRSCGAVRAAMCARRSLVERRWCGARRPRVCRMCIYVRVCATYGRAARCARPCARGARWWSGAGAARGGRVCVVCAYMCACALRTVVRRGARGHVREALAGGAALVRREAAACVSYVHICARVRYVRSCGAVRAAMCARRSLVERRWCGARRPRVCRMCIYVRVCATYGRAARCARPCARGARWWSGAGAARGGRVCVVCAYMCACALRTVVRRGARGHVREALAGGAALVRREAAACVSYVHICARVRYVRSCGAVRAAMCARRSLVERRWCGARRPRVCRMCIYVRVCATYGRAARCARPCARGARWWSGAGAARGGRVCVVCAYMCACALRTVVRRGARGHVREALAGGAALVRREAAACVSYVHICARVRYVRSCGAVRAAMCARRSLVERRWCGARRPRVCRMCIYVRVCATYGRAARCARPCARGARWWSGAGAARGGRVCVVCAYMCACALRTVVRRGARGHVREALAGGAALVRREAAACVSYVHICARVRYVRSCGAVRAAMCARRSLVERRWCGARRPRVCRMCIYVRVCATYGRAARCARPCARGARWWSGAGAARGGRVCVVCAYMCACALRTVVRRGARGHVREALAGGAALVRREAAACVSYVHICARVRYVRSCGAVRAAMCARRSLVERRWCGARRPRVCRMCIYVRVCATYGRAARCARPCARGARWWSGAGAARGGRVCVVCAYMCACALRTVVRRGARGHVREALAGGAALVRREAAACVSYVHICARVRYVRSCGAVRAAMCARRSLVERRWCGARRPRVCRMCIYVRVCATYGRAARCARPCARGARWWSGAGAARGGRVCVVCAYMCACALRTVVRRGARGHVREALAGGAALVRREAAACVSYVHICARVRYVRSCGAVRAAMCARRSLVERRWCGARRPRVCRMCIYVRVCATYGRAARCARPCARGARWWSGAGAARGGRVCVVCAYMCACALRTVVRRGARGHVREALAGGAALVRREAAACVSYVHICARVRYVRSCGAVRAAMCARRSLVERRWCGARQRARRARAASLQSPPGPEPAPSSGTISTCAIKPLQLSLWHLRLFP
ncbi:unnamed protein product [Euphydryas editha]|uniref:Uncharacterized protein n=1 Tax=Euphydryas editha TaxID=104508 RepID=A0AAU9TC51_EUPED|nr:unnamed protein product [Euphydryas editha]